MAKKKKARISLTTWLLFIAGFLLIGYPLGTQAYMAMQQTHVVKGYYADTSHFGKSEQDALTKAIDKRNAEIREKAAKANNQADEKVIDAMVELNQKKAKETDGTAETGKPLGVLSIPELGGLRLPIYDGISDKILSSGAGLIPGTSVPQADVKGVSSVITSHSGLPTAKLFTYLGMMKKQDKFYIEINGRTLTYQVDRIKTVLPEDLQKYFVMDQDENYVTLMTCTPVGVNSHRLLVRGHQIPTVKVPGSGVQSEYLWFGGLVILAVLVFSRLAYRTIKLRRR
jgi:sortase A